MNARPIALLSRVFPAIIVSGLLLVAAVRLLGQNNPTLTILSRDGRKTIPITLINNQEFVGLDDLGATFQLTVREESGAITASYKGRTIVLTADQTLTSVSGRLVSLPAAPVRMGTRWVVPIEFVSRALALVYDSRLDLRRPSRLLVVGDFRVPRVTIRLEPLANAARLTIDATPRAASTLAQEAGRVLIKFDADAIDVTLPSFQPEALVSAVRVADAVTLAVELGPRFGALRASSEAIADTTRLVLDLAGTENTTAGAAPAPATPPPPSPTPAELPAFGQPVALIRTIAVDAGHGGDDEGVKGAAGAVEKEITLAVARRLKSTIEARLGVRVILTRDEDRNVPIDERAAIANNGKADLFISLHTNGALRGSASGASLSIAAFNQADQTRAALAPARVPTFGGGSRDIELVAWDVAQMRYLDQSARFAQLLQDQFQGRIPLDEHQGLGAGPFRVLESANMPAVLIEMGFLTNADQEKQLAGSEFQNAFAQAVMDSVLKFREYLEQSTGGAR